MEILPIKTEDLIRKLDKDYPIYQPKVTDTMEIIQRKAGQRDVVSNLLAALNRQELT